MNFFLKRSFLSRIIVLLLPGICLLFLIRCSKFDAPAKYTPIAADTVRYVENDTDFANPERGFYRYSETHANNYIPLDSNQMKKWRTLQQADGGGNYQIYSTLIFRYFVLDGLTNSVLPADLLTKIQTDFDLARAAGVKLIARFAYTITTHPGGCPDSGECPPYGDAPKSTVLQHISQLAPLLQKNEDVIACMQLGFIGIWGENYYSDYFGDASGNGNGQLFDNNWQDRIDVLKALLTALPADRMIQVRYPQFKQKYVYGIDAPVSSAALTTAQAFTQTDQARIGMHNDCFISSANDYGTYDDYGTSSTPRQGATSVLRSFASADNQFVAVGGETCDDAYSPQNNCENAGIVQTELNTMHYSFLNCAYNNDLNNIWVSGGCMDNIKRNLGYRFVLKNGLFPASAVQAGLQFKFTLNLVNQGYASPFNPRPAMLIMRNQSTNKEIVFKLASDPRTWFTGNVQVNETISTDAAMPKGKYSMFLYMPDNSATIAARPEYAIRLANANCWEATTGYNDLSVTLTIN
ncbi:DUF4832 domain-containing protein [Flavitalea flava]